MTRKHVVDRDRGRLAEPASLMGTKQLTVAAGPSPMPRRNPTDTPTFLWGALEGQIGRTGLGHVEMMSPAAPAPRLRHRVVPPSPAGHAGAMETAMVRGPFEAPLGSAGEPDGIHGTCRRVRGESCRDVADRKSRLWPCSGASVEKAGDLARIGGGSVRRARTGRPGVGEAYRPGRPGFKQPRFGFVGGLAYGMAQAATRCTHIGSRVRPQAQADRGGWRLSGRARDPDPRRRVGASPGCPARECVR
jgi:hypothetical protein